jgi:hypothetical protein
MRDEELRRVAAAPTSHVPRDPITARERLPVRLRRAAGPPTARGSRRDIHPGRLVLIDVQAASGSRQGSGFLVAAHGRCAPYRDGDDRGYTTLSPNPIGEPLEPVESLLGQGVAMRGVASLPLHIPDPEVRDTQLRPGVRLDEHHVVSTDHVEESPLLIPGSPCTLGECTDVRPQRVMPPQKVDQRFV